MLPSIFLWLRKFLMPLTDVFNLSCPKVITKTSVKNLEKLMQVFTSPKPTETVAFLIFRFFSGMYQEFSLMFCSPNILHSKAFWMSTVFCVLEAKNIASLCTSLSAVRREALCLLNKIYRDGIIIPSKEDIIS